MKKIDLNFYPNWVRKAITFTIDDGNIKLDTKFLGITKPAGLKGTFNLCTPLKPDVDYKSFYEGYEISNHAYQHPYALTERTRREIKNEPFDKPTADRAYGYPAPDAPGLIRVCTYNWTYMAPTTEIYLDCVHKAQAELEAIFGKGRIRSYVWPFGKQDNDQVNAAMRKEGFLSMRITGCVKDTTGFAFPADRQAWSYNADYTCLPEVSAAYRAYPDDGHLKFFCFGVHSHDFENNNCWNLLEDFARDFGNRPEEFYYASVGDLLDYEDAVASVIVTDEKIQNPSTVDLYIKIDGIRKTLRAKSEILL